MDSFGFCPKISRKEQNCDTVSWVSDLPFGGFKADTRHSCQVYLDGALSPGAGSLLSMLSGFFQGNLILLYRWGKINCFHNAVGLVSSYQGYRRRWRADRFLILIAELQGIVYTLSAFVISDLKIEQTSLNVKSLILSITGDYWISTRFPSLTVSVLWY